MKDRVKALKSHIALLNDLSLAAKGKEKLRFTEEISNARFELQALLSKAILFIIECFV